MKYDEMAILEKLKKAAPRHASPYSTLIVAMGDYWEPGCRESIEAMRDYTRKLSIDAQLHIERDRCYHWGDALGSMRNMGYRTALLSGFEYLMYVDNDVLVPEHCLMKLISHMLPIVAPKITFASGEDYGLQVPKLRDDEGLVVAGSVVLSCILIKTAVFYPWATADFWGNTLGDDEEYHFTKFYMLGHMPFVDTDVQAVCLKPPHFPQDHKGAHIPHPGTQRKSGLVVVQ